MWYQQPYLNRRDWILYHVAKLQLDPGCFLVLLMIDYLNQQGETIDVDRLAEKTGMNRHAVDEAIRVLTQRKALLIRVEQGRTAFSIDGVFQEQGLYEFVSDNIFDVFEQEFGRPLSQNELTKLNGMLAKIPKELVGEALRQASIEGKLSMPYIQAIAARLNKEQQ